MNVYIFQAALLCEACGEAQRAALQADCPTCGGEHANLPYVDCRSYYPPGQGGACMPDPRSESEYDSDDYPKGPYPDGGGEADSPQHCDQCGVFLENSLTRHGYDYVREAIALDLRRVSIAARVWAPFYNVAAPTTKQLFRELAPDYSPSNDPWGHAMGAFFAVADELYERTSGGSVEPGMPAEWRFRRGMAGYQDTDSHEYEALQELKPSTAELFRLGCFLHRLTGRLDRAGFSY
ncbi:MAG: hypothetical protein Q7J84_10535 [Sulfuricaulis sp.]|nr:hypothetical protein [Sulfuricaulis sp.]